MTEKQAITGARIFYGEVWHDNMMLIVADGHVEGLAAADSPTDAIRVPADGAMLVPGFLDLQVNGGGGTLLNDTPTVEGIRSICAAFMQFGTVGCLPTMITDTPEQNDRVIAAGIAAAAEGVPGFLGLHIEGPHFALARKGTHNPRLIRPMEESDVLRLIAAAGRLPKLLVTLAPEIVTTEQIARLTAGGVIVSIGHSDATFAQANAAVEAGATVVTHLFNAQSQLTNREPGIVGAALDNGILHAGLIADGIHVHPASIGAALRAKRGPGHIYLVTDAMSPVGTDWTQFDITGQTVYRKDRALRLADGTLAGADLTMIEAVVFMHRTVGLPLEEALRMASTYPAAVIAETTERGHLARGARADFVVLDADLGMRSTWIGGQKVFG